MSRQLEVVTPEGAAGLLVKESQHVFNYRSADPATEVSLSMPLKAASYNSNPLHPAFAMNLPEGFLLDRLRSRLGKFGKLDDMRLLEHTGRQQIGRLQYLTESGGWETPRATATLQQLLDEGNRKGIFDYLVETYLEAGIAGVQPKVLLPDGSRQPADGDRATVIQPDLIVKAAGSDYEGLAANEFACMSAARRAQIDTPEFWLSDDDTLFVMRRFDLNPGRRGFEDIATVAALRTGSDDGYKYKGSYEAVAAVIATYAGPGRAVALEQFFDYVVLSVMVRNGDAHLKNFGLTYSTPQAGDVELAPLFDVVTTTIYTYPSPKTGESLVDRTMALKLMKRDKNQRYPVRSEMIEFGRKVCGVARPEQAIDRIATAVRTTMGEELRRVPDSIRGDMAAAWSEGLSTLATAEPARARGSLRKGSALAP